MDDAEVVDFAISHARFEGQKAYYASHRNRYVFTSELLRSLSPPERFLEVGSSGLFLKIMKWLNPATDCFGTQYADVPGYKEELIPFDPEETGRFFLGNPERHQYDVADSLFDMILCAEVIEHMTVDPMALLAELNRITQIGGTLILTTPNITSIRSLFFALNGRMPYNFFLFNRDGTPDRHNIEYSPDMIEAMVVAAGYRVEALFTKDAWSSPTTKEMALLEAHGFPTECRGDNIFCVARKVGAVVDRFPEFLYVQN